MVHCLTNDVLNEKETPCCGKRKEKKCAEENAFVSFKLKRHCNMALF